MKKNIESFQRIIKNKHKKIDEIRQFLIENDETAKNAFLQIKDLGYSYCMGEISEKEFDERSKKCNETLKKQLLENGFSKDSLEVKISCDICMDEGYVSGNMCQCLKDYLLEEKQSEKIKENFSLFDEKLFSEKESNEKKSPRENILKIREKSYEFINNFEENAPLGLIFMGVVGSGKSFMAKSIGYELINKGYDVSILSAFALEEALRGYNEEKFREKINFLYTSDLLIIDDLGVETQSDFMNNNILKIIENRIDSEKKTIITTNLKLSEILNMYKTKIYSRIVGNYEGYNFYADDLRVIKRMVGK